MKRTGGSSAGSQDRLAEQATEILAGAIVIAHAIEEARLRPRGHGSRDMSRLFQEEIEMSEPATRNTSVTQPPLLLSAEDHDRLIGIAHAVLVRYPAEDARFLLDELDRADVVPPEWVPDNVVTMNSYVEFVDSHTGATRRVQVVFPYQADISRGRISVLSPVGAALIGLAEGQSISWRTSGRRDRGLTVLRVSRMPLPTRPSPVAVSEKEGEPA